MQALLQSDGHRFLVSSIARWFLAGQVDFGAVLFFRLQLRSAATAVTAATDMNVGSAAAADWTDLQLAITRCCCYG